MAIITKAALAAELGITKGRVSQYVKAGMPVREDGKLDREAALGWTKLNRSTFRSGDKGAARAAKLAPAVEPAPPRAKPTMPAPAASAPDAAGKSGDLDLEGERTRKLRLANDEAERKLIPEHVFEEACDLLVGPALVDLLSLPARVTDDLRLRRLMEDEIDAIRTRHADRLERVLGDVLAGRALDAGDGETDAAAADGAAESA